MDVKSMLAHHRKVKRVASITRSSNTPRKRKRVISSNRKEHVSDSPVPMLGFEADATRIDDTSEHLIISFASAEEATKSTEARDEEVIKVAEEEAEGKGQRQAAVELQRSILRDAARSLGGRDIAAVAHPQARPRV